MIIPFFIPHAGCPHQCVFCNQKRITGKLRPPHPASISEIISTRLAASARRQEVQVAFYGGSFTALPAPGQQAYLRAVAPFLATGEIESIRISTRPDGITPDIVKFLREHKVRTVELGVQSMDDEVLRLSGRGHTAADTLRAEALLRDNGFTVGMQLMPGLPGDTPQKFHETIAQVIRLAPSFVRLYPTLVIKDTPLESLYRTGRYQPLELDDAVSLCCTAVNALDAAGIGIARVGLQTAEALEQPGTIVAGPWHPAFGQLVASAVFLEKMRYLLAASGTSSSATIYVNPADQSTAIGQQRRNIRILREAFALDLQIKTSPLVPRGSVHAAPPCTFSVIRI